MDQVENLKIDEIVDNKYRLLKQLGEGGSAVVFQAIHTTMGTQLAIKLIKQTFVEDEGLSRFKTEAQILAQLQHQNIVRLFHCGFTPKNTPYMAMEFANGTSLRARLQAGPKLSPEEIADIVAQSLAGLTYAHNLGFVHRDLKPENIMLCEVSGQTLVKLVDFGLAKILPTAQLKSQHSTQTGMVVGSPLYMSPEQCIGSDINARSDIYSLGCILYEMIVGRPPFHADSENGVILQHHNAAVPAISLPQNASLLEKGLAAIATNCMQKSPTHRYQSAEKMQSVLSDLRRNNLMPTLTAKQFVVNFGFNTSQKIYCAGIGIALVTIVTLFWQSTFTRQQAPEMHHSLSVDELSRRKHQLESIFTEEHDPKADPQVVLNKFEHWQADNPPTPGPPQAYSMSETRLERLRLLNPGLCRTLNIRLNKLKAARAYEERILEQAALLSSTGFVDTHTCHGALGLVGDLKYTNLSSRLEELLDKLRRCSILDDDREQTKELLTIALANMYLEPGKINERRIAKAKQLLANQRKQVKNEEKNRTNKSIRQLLALHTAADPAHYIRSTDSITENTTMQTIELAKRFRQEGKTKRGIELLTALTQAQIESASKEDAENYHRLSITHLAEALCAELREANIESPAGQRAIDDAIKTLSAERSTFSSEPPNGACRFSVDDTLAFAYQLKGKFSNPIFLEKARAIVANGFKLTKDDHDSDIPIRYNQKLAELLINGKKTDECLAVLRACDGMATKSAPTVAYNRCGFYRELGIEFCEKKDAANAGKCLDYCLQPEKLRLIVAKGTPGDKGRVLELARRILILEPTNEHAKEQLKALEKAFIQQPITPQQ